MDSSRRRAGTTWNTGTIEAHYTYSPQLILIGRYELVRMSRQALASNPSELGNADVFTIGYRYYPFMHSRDGLAWHQEYATIRSKLTSSYRTGSTNQQLLHGVRFCLLKKREDADANYL